MRLCCRDTLVSLLQRHNVSLLQRHSVSLLQRHNASLLRRQCISVAETQCASVAETQRVSRCVTVAHVGVLSPARSAACLRALHPASSPASRPPPSATFPLPSLSHIASRPAPGGTENCFSTGLRHGSPARGPSAGPPGLVKTVSRPACVTAPWPGRPKTVSRAAWSCCGVVWWCHVQKTNPALRAGTMQWTYA